MTRKKIWGKTDNSMEKQKAELRIRNLPNNARILDLFCGMGEMYNRAYKGRVSRYHGTDKEKVHDPAVCTLINNTVYIAHNDISDYNVFDLDDYGTPWKLIYLILRKLPPGEITMFITDGLVMHQKVDGTVTKFVSATERVPQKMNLPGINRFYVDIFATMLKDIERRYGWITQKAQYFHNDRRSVYYWALKLRHNTLDAI
jgi:hypothetical protein